MDLRFNSGAPFTRWVVVTGTLAEPFVVVDVGVQGGESIRWHLLGDRLVVHGFDPIGEVIDVLRAAAAPRRHYHVMAAGDVDGECTLHVNLDNPTSSSLYAQGTDRYGTTGRWAPRRVLMHRLDTLLGQGVIPPADFLKVDVEGFERSVLVGADRLLSTVLGVDIETNFGVSPTYPETHFGAIQAAVLPHGLLVMDLNYNRVPRATFRAAVERTGRAVGGDVGQIATVNALFCRDLIAEQDHPENYTRPLPAPTTDQLVKAMIIAELYGLADVAVDTAERFRSQLATRLDVDHAIRLLTDARKP